MEPAPGDGERQGSLACCSPWVSQTWLSDWTATAEIQAQQGGQKHQQERCLESQRMYDKMSVNERGKDEGKNTLFTV